MITITNFGGMSEIVEPRYLKDSAATFCSDCDFSSGALQPVMNNAPAGFTGSSDTETIYKYGEGEWFSWDEDVDVALAPVPYNDSRWTVFTGTGSPQQTKQQFAVAGAGSLPAQSFRLGIPAPAQPVVEVVGQPPVPDGWVTYDDGTFSGFVPDDWVADYDDVVVGSDGNGDPITESQIVNYPSYQPEYQYETRAYAITYVNEWGQEGTGAISEGFEAVDGQNVKITLPNTFPTGDLYNAANGAKVRIYRSNSGTQDTDFQFVMELAINTLTAYDDTKNYKLQEVMETLNWIKPPDDDLSLYSTGEMLGVRALPNGVLVGFSGNTLVYSVPYAIHAYPYTYPVRDKIVAIEVTSEGVLVATEGRPAIALGLDPQAVFIRDLDEVRACVSKRSMVDAGEYAVYASHEGLIGLEQGQTRNLTAGIFDRAQWQAYQPETITGSYYQGKYFGSYGPRNDRKGFILDLSSGDFTFIDEGFVTTCYSAKDDQLYGVNSQGNIYAIGGMAIPRFADWVSKEFQLDKPTAYSRLQVIANGYPVEVRLIRDGVEQLYSVPSDKPIPIQSGRAHKWQIKIGTTHRVTRVSLGRSVKELQGV